MHCKTHRVVIVAIIFMLGISGSVWAQEKNITYSNQQWIQFYEQARLNSHWAIFADAGYRWKNNFSETSQYIARVSLGYQMNPDMRISVGFANLGFYSVGPLSKLEFRPYEEWILSNPRKTIKIQHRFRLEERIFKTVSDGIMQPSTNFNFRFRYRILFNIPIARLSKNNLNLKLSLNAGDEIMLNAGQKIVYNLFDQNRILIGPALKINKNFSLSLTYNDEFCSTTEPGKFKHTDVIWLGIKHNFSFTADKKESR